LAVCSFSLGLLLAIWLAVNIFTRAGPEWIVALVVLELGPFVMLGFRAAWTNRPGSVVLAVGLVADVLLGVWAAWSDFSHSEPWKYAQSVELLWVMQYLVAGVAVFVAGGGNKGDIRKMRAQLDKLSDEQREALRRLARSGRTLEAIQEAGRILGVSPEDAAFVAEELPK
jgi:hypothetical protein